MKKRILIILPFVPYPLESGGQISVFEMIDALRNKVEISLLMPWGNSINELKDIWPGIDIFFFKRNLKDRILRKLSIHAFYAFLKLFSSLFKRPVLFSKSDFFFDVNFNLIDIANDLIKKNNYDYVQIEFFENLPLICFLPESINSIFVHHEIRFVRNERTLNLLNDKSRFLGNFFLSQLKGQEIELLKKYDKVVTVSDVDKKILSQYIDPLKVVSSPLTIKFDAKIATDYLFENKLFYLGGAQHKPNLNALKWFLDNCWEAVLNEHPGLKLIVIGVWDERLKLDICKKFKRVEFLGFVQNLESVFKNGILVVPLLIGSGMRMKVIDSVNFGIPFITTTIGVEGLNFIDSESCFIADTPADFIIKVNMLIDCEELQKSFIKNARLLLKSDYAYNKVIDIRESIY